MMFFLHILVLIYGLGALVVGKFRTSGPLWSAADNKVYEVVEQFWPDNLYKPWVTGVTELIPDMTRTYAIGGGLVAYSLWYLSKCCRG